MKKLIILFVLITNLVSAQTRYVDFGASLGYLTSIESYDGAIESGVKYGIKHWRIFDPFSKGFDTNVVKIADKVSYLIKTKGATSVLISVSNNAYSQLYKDTVGREFSEAQRKTFGFTNRCFPKDTIKYANLLKKLGTELVNRGLINKVEFEFNNEGDAGIYFLGTRDELVRLNRIKHNALKEFNRPMLAGSYTSSLMSDTSYKHKKDWYDQIMTDTIFNNDGFSHSFYWTDSRITNSNDTFTTFMLNNNDYPDRSFKYTYVTEYNLYTTFKTGSVRDSVFNSYIYVKQFVEFLRWIYNKPQIKRVYIHPFCELQPGLDDRGTMGIWKLNIQPVTFRKYYTFKPAGKMFYDILKVVKDGYTLLPNGLKGKGYSLILSGNTYSVITNQ